jgi:hypothetical protein
MAGRRRKLEEPAQKPRVEIRPRPAVSSTLLPRIPLSPHLAARRNFKESRVLERTAQQVIARKNLLDELEHTLIRRLGHMMHDTLRQPKESRDCAR